MRQVTCNQCQKEFKIKKIKKKQAGLYKGDKVRLHYFACPKCKHEYIVKVDTRLVNKKVEKIRELQKKIAIFNRDIYDPQFKKVYREYQKVMKEAKKLSDEIKSSLIVK